MNDKFIFDEEGKMVLTDNFIKEIESTVAKLKASNPQIRKVFPIVIAGQEYDSKPLYVGYFKQPDFKTFSKYLAASQKDNAVAMKQLAKDCLIDGDKDLVEDDSLFLFGLMGQLSQLIEIRQGTLVNLSTPGK